MPVIWSMVTYLTFIYCRLKNVWNWTGCRASNDTVYYILHQLAMQSKKSCMILRCIYARLCPWSFVHWLSLKVCVCGAHWWEHQFLTSTSFTCAKQSTWNTALKLQVAQQCIISSSHYSIYHLPIPSNFAYTQSCRQIYFQITYTCIAYTHHVTSTTQLKSWYCARTNCA
jgi:hypothetical protein